MFTDDAVVFADGERFTLLHGNALSIPMADETVDLVVTSPPYFALRSYSDGGEHYAGQIGSEPTPAEFLEALWAVTAECVRVLKPSGSIFINLGDKYCGYSGEKWGNGRSLGSGRGDARVPATGPVSAPAVYGVPAKSLMLLPHRYAIGCVDRLGLICRAEVVWSKPNGLPESVQDRVRRSHEMWFHFTKGPRYYQAVDAIREDHAATSVARSGRNRFAADHSQDGVGSPNTVDPADACHPLGKLPGSVWTIPTEPLLVPDYFVDDGGEPKMLDCAELWRWVAHRVDHGDLRPVVVRPIDHFAAFPQEWPRRLILGWSPSGICTVCGEGRRPAVERTARSKWEGEPPRFGTSTPVAGSPVGRLKGGEVRSLGTDVCACVAPDAPTTPAVVLDPFGGTGTTAMVARALGRHGVHLDLSLDYLRLAHWRITQSGHSTKTVARTNGDRQGTLL